MTPTCACGREGVPVYDEVDIGVGVQKHLVAFECLIHGGICGVAGCCGVLDRIGERHAVWCPTTPSKEITAESFDAETDKLAAKVVERFRLR